MYIPSVQIEEGFVIQLDGQVDAPLKDHLRQDVYKQLSMAGLPGQLLGELLGPLELFGADQFQDQFEYVPVVEPDFPRTRGCPVLVPDLLPGLASPKLLFSDVMKFDGNKTWCVFTNLHAL